MEDLLLLRRVVHIDTVKLLLESGADVKHRTLELAIENRHSEVINLLIEYGADTVDV